MKLALLLSAALLTACCTTDLLKDILTETQFAVVDTNHSSTTCMRAARTTCGMTVWDCSNGLKYECVNNVVIIDIAEVKGLAR